MAKGFKHGAGGMSLNFKVVGGRSQPAFPVENMIWVNTSAPITGWVFSAEEPTAPAEGLVWISTGKVSPVEFNAVRRNSIMVCPLAARQYVGGWLDKEARTYQGGEWMDWITYIIREGKAEKTFAYVKGSLGYGEMSGAQGDGSYDLTCRLLNNYQGMAKSLMCVSDMAGEDLSNWKEICVVASKVDSATSAWKLCIIEGSAVPSSVPTTFVASADLPGSGTVVLPLDGLTPGNYVVCIHGETGYTSTLKITEFSLR